MQHRGLLSIVIHHCPLLSNVHCCPLLSIEKPHIGVKGDCPLLSIVVVCCLTNYCPLFSIEKSHIGMKGDYKIIPSRLNHLCSMSPRGSSVCQRQGLILTLSQLDYVASQLSSYYSTLYVNIARIANALQCHS